MKTIVLMGIKHCGKSTQGKIISQKLNLPFYDTDDVIAEMTGKTPREIYTEKGQEGFMEAEKNACEFVKKETALKNINAVIATGGGICGNTQAVEILKSFGTLVFLEVEEKIATARVLREIKVEPDGTLSNMPAYIAKKNPRTVQDAGMIFHDFFSERVKVYKELVDLTINVSGSSKSENADKIIEAVNS
ncbi:shikimate kinase [Treponema sp.]|uniref:shikimate kinase n=1 Tax=Treponema sp. TaxID=166 RepID=UPI00388F5307